MSPVETRDEGLARLAREVMSPEWPSADALARYVDDPDSLSPDERRAFIAAMEASPELRAQVRVMQTTNIDDLLARRDAQDDAAAAATGHGSPPRRRRRAVPALAGLAAAAATLLFLKPVGLFGPETSPLRGTRTDPPVAEDTVTPEPTPRTPLLPDAAVHYASPAGAPRRPRLESVVRLGEGRELRGVAVVPEHIGRTQVAAPSVFWHLSGSLPERGEFVLRIARADDAEPLIEMALRERPRVGFQEIRLAELGIDLPVAMTYRWSVLYAASASRPRHPVAEGWIQRYPASLNAGSPLDEARGFAREGFWYDAFAAAHPPGGVLEQARRGLLAEVGLERLLEAPPEP